MRTRQVEASELREGNLFLIRGHPHRLVSKKVNEITGLVSLLFKDVDKPPNAMTRSTKKFPERMPNQIIEEIVGD